MKSEVHLWLYVAKFLLLWEMFPEKKCSENQNIFILNYFFFFFENLAFRKSCLSWGDTVEKIC